MKGLGAGLEVSTTVVIRASNFQECYALASSFLRQTGGSAVGTRRADTCAPGLALPVPPHPLPPSRASPYPCPTSADVCPSTYSAYLSAFLMFSPSSSMTQIHILKPCDVATQPRQKGEGEGGPRCKEKPLRRCLGFAWGVGVG